MQILMRLYVDVIIAGCLLCCRNAQGVLHSVQSDLLSLLQSLTVAPPQMKQGYFRGICRVWFGRGHSLDKLCGFCFLC